LAEAHAQIAGVIFRFQQGLELDEREQSEKQGGAGADRGQNDPPNHGVFFGSTGHNVF